MGIALFYCLVPMKKLIIAVLICSLPLTTHALGDKDKYRLQGAAAALLIGSIVHAQKEKKAAEKQAQALQQRQPTVIIAPAQPSPAPQTQAAPTNNGIFIDQEFYDD